MESLSKELDVKHCVLIVVDALRVDRLGVYNENYRFVSKYLSRLGERGVVFRNAFTVINATDPSFTSMYTGSYPSSQGLINHGEHVSKEELENISTIPFLQEILSKSKVRTIAIDWLGRWHRRGFNLYIDPRGRYAQVVQNALRKLKSSRISRLIGAQAIRDKHGSVKVPYTAKEAFEKAKKVIKKYKNERAFILIHLWDTHIPYNNVPEQYNENRKRYRGKVWDKLLPEALEPVKGPWRNKLISMFSSEVTLGDIVARYDSAVAYVDSAIKEFIEFLEELNLLDDTLLIITSDHGESLIEHNIFFDHHGLYDPSIRIPLIIYNPRLTPHEISSFVQNIDLMPTILDIFNTKIGTTSIEGAPLLRLILNKENEQIRSEVFIEESYTERKLAIRTERYKYIVAPDATKATCRYCGYIHGGSLEELYDLKRDSEESNNIITAENDIVKGLRKLLKSYVKRIELKRKAKGLARKLRR